MIKDCASSSKNMSIQEADYTKDTVKAGTDYVEEYIIEQEGNQQQVIMREISILGFQKKGGIVIG